MKKSLDQYSLVFVEWIDSTEICGWVGIDIACVPPKGLRCVSTGVLVEEREDAIAVAASVQVDEDGLVTGVCSPMTIPRSAITKIQTVFVEGNRATDTETEGQG